MTVSILRGDARNLPLAAGSVDLVVTSPPYHALRSYQDGGKHYEGQIGSEETPHEFVESLLDVTRECVRVLKPSGSLFVNLGDRYSGGEPVSRDGMTMEDAAWLAGVIDSDGSISVHLNKQPEGRAPSFVPWVRVGQMRPEVVRQIRAVTGTGQVYQDKRGVWCWNAAAQQAGTVLRWIWPWLHIKQRQALAAVELARHIGERRNKGTWSMVTTEDIAYRQSIRDAVLAWNAGERWEWDPPRIPLPSLPRRRTWIPTKSLSGLPWRYAIRCIDDLGLILRAEIIWSKPNGLPESVTDRVRRSHETWFHFTVSPRYFSAVDEIREANTCDRLRGSGPRFKDGTGRNDADEMRSHANPLGKLPGSVWTVPTQPLTVPAHLGVDHFAAFPTEWPKRLISGWCPAEVCTVCGEGRRPVVDKGAPFDRSLVAHRGGNYVEARGDGGAVAHASGQEFNRWKAANPDTITGYACACPDTSAPATPGVVLDPFGGTGTTALVAHALGRHGISVDLSADYCRLAEWRTSDRGELARVLGVPKPPVQIEGQADLFGEEAS